MSKGGQIYKQAFNLCQNIFLTRVERKVSNELSVIECDTHLDMLSEIESQFSKVNVQNVQQILGNGVATGEQTENEYVFEFQIWARK